MMFNTYWSSGDIFDVRFGISKNIHPPMYAQYVQAYEAASPLSYLAAVTSHWEVAKTVGEIRVLPTFNTCFEGA